MGFTNKDREEDRNLPRNLPGDRPNHIPILEFNEITFYDRIFSKKGFIKWLTEFKVYFYFNKVPYHQKVGHVAHKLYLVLENGDLNFWTLDLVLVCL
jgi:hypothetical protein